MEPGAAGHATVHRLLPRRRPAHLNPGRTRCEYGAHRGCRSGASGPDGRLTQPRGHGVGDRFTRRKRRPAGRIVVAHRLLGFLTMAVPLDLVLVRHGLSEANIVQRAEKAGQSHPALDEVYERQDYQQRLALEAVRQAEIAGEWLREHAIAPEDFDERYVSPFNRTMDTARHLGGDRCEWLVEFRLVERDWGHYGATPKHERSELFPHTDRAMEEASFFARLDGGESIGDVAYRFRDFIDTLTRDMADRRVLVVTHGELMWTARFVIERMLPQEWQELDLDTTLRIGNCCVMWYTRQNPDDPSEIRSSLSAGWLRLVDPVEPARSPYNGQWQELPGKRRLDGRQLDALTRGTPRLL